MMKDETPQTPHEGAFPAPPSRPRRDYKLIAIGPEESAALDCGRIKEPAYSKELSKAIEDLDELDRVIRPDVRDL